MPIWERSHEHKLYRMVLASFSLADKTSKIIINMVNYNKFVVLNVTSRPRQATGYSADKSA